MTRARSPIAWTALAAALVGAGEARAWLETGTLLTNTASATFAYRSGAGGSITYSATMKVLMANPAVLLYKKSTPTVITTVGGRVTYMLAFSNGGANTAFNVTINDTMPIGSSAWWQGYTPSGGGCGAEGVGFWVGGGAIMIPTFSQNGGASWTNGTPPIGQQGPVMLRWVVPMLGVGVSGVINYVVSLG